MSDFTIERVSTSTQVARVLRERIFKGELPPGTPLREVALASSLGISRNSLREGIRVLVSEGLLTHHVHRGVVVTELTPDDVHDIYLVRKTLETAAVRTMPLRRGSHLDRMAEIISELDNAVAADDREMIVDLDFVFHSEIVRAAGSERLSAFYANTLGELRLGLFVLDRMEEEWRDWMLHHASILKALVEGRRVEAIRQVESHLKEAERRLLAVVDRV